MSSHVPNGKDADAHHHNVAVDNIVVVGKSITVPKVNANVVEANEVVASEMLANNLTVNTINGLPPGTGGGGGSTTNTGVFTDLTPVVVFTDQFEDAAGTPDTTIPMAAGVFTRGVDLGAVFSSAWVSIPVGSQGNNAQTDVVGRGSVDIVTGAVSGNAFGLTYSTVYVTENPQEAQRFTGHAEEYAIDGTTNLGYTTLKKTYSEIGNYVFGTYTNTTGGTNVASFAFPFVNPRTSTDFVVQGMYLDNSGPTTRLMFDFNNYGTHTGASDFTSMSTGSNSARRIAVYGVSA